VEVTGYGGQVVAGVVTAVRRLEDRGHPAGPETVAEGAEVGIAGYRGAQGAEGVVCPQCTVRCLGSCSRAVVGTEPGPGVAHGPPAIGCHSRAATGRQRACAMAATVTGADWPRMRLVATAAATGPCRPCGCRPGRSEVAVPKRRPTSVAMANTPHELLVRDTTVGALKHRGENVRRGVGCRHGWQAVALEVEGTAGVRVEPGCCGPQTEEGGERRFGEGKVAGAEVLAHGTHLGVSRAADERAESVQKQDAPEDLGLSGSGDRAPWTAKVARASRCPAIVSWG